MNRTDEIVAGMIEDSPPEGVARNMRQARRAKLAGEALREAEESLRVAALAESQGDKASARSARGLAAVALNDYPELSARILEG